MDVEKRDSREEFLKDFDKESQLGEIAPRNSKKSPLEIKSLLLKFLFFFFAVFIVFIIAGARTADNLREISKEEAAAAEVVTQILQEFVEIDEIVVFEESSEESSDVTMGKQTTIEENIVGRWEEVSSTGVSDYIDAEGGGYFYKMFAKKMKADVEYKLVKPSVYEATFYLSFAPPMKFPMRFDQPYQYKSPAGSKVQSVAKYRSMLDDIFVNTKGGKEGPTITNIQIIDSQLQITSTILDKNVTCIRVYSKKTSDV